jgi:prepilin-type N-terminal cleavage/methylation domain-containing protein
VNRLAQEDGFTLPELIVAMAIGVFVLMAGATTLDHAISASTTVQRRVDAAQRGRTAMEEVIRELRSQVCVTADWTADGKALPPIRVAASAPTTTAPTADGTQSVAFYVDLQRTDPLKSSSPKPPDLRVITYDGAARKLKEDIYTPSVVAGKASYPASPTKKTVLLSDVERSADPTTKQKLPVFRFYQYNASAVPPQPTLEVLPWAADADKVAKVTVAFSSRPTGASASPSLDTVLVDDAFVREVDPYDSSHAPKCT